MSDKNEMDLNERMKEARKARGFSQRILAEKLGIHELTYVKYEKGEREPKASVIKDFIQITGVACHWLLSGKGEMYPRIGIQSRGDNFSILLEYVKEVYPGLEIDANVKSILRALPDTILRNSMANTVILTMNKYPEIYQEKRKRKTE